MVLLAFPSPAYSQVTFSDVSMSAGIDHHVNPHPYAQQRTGGVAWFDFDNDGWEDLYFTGAGNGDQLYRNLQNGQFEDVSITSGIFDLTVGILTLGVATGDLNRDGFEDIVLSTDASHGSLVLFNNGTNAFIDGSMNAEVIDTSFSFGVSVMDFNNDGWLDIYFANWLDNPLFETTYSDRLYENDGDGTFTDVTNITGIYSIARAGTGCGFSDFDLDGDLDLLLINDYGPLFWTEGNKLFENVSNGFSDISSGSGFDIDIFGFGIATGDFDEDGDFDYYINQIGSNSLLVNDGGTFFDIAATVGVEARWNVIDSANAAVFTEGMSWGNCFFDYDNDSYLDLFVSNGRLPLYGQESVDIDENRLFRNLGAGNFEDVSVQSGMAHGLNNKGCAAADYDHDGDMDMAVVTSDTVNGTGRTMLMQNQGGSGFNWLALELVGVTSNLEAVGATVRVYFEGRMLIREVEPGGGSYLSQHSKVVHVGLGQAQSVDSVAVRWPGGLTESFHGLGINQRLQLVEGTGGMITGVEQEYGSIMKIFPNPSSSSVHISVNDENDAHLFVHDIAGRIIAHLHLSGSKYEQRVELGTLSNGTYFASLIEQDRSTIARVKFLVMH